MFSITEKDLIIIIVTAILSFITGYYFHFINIKKRDLVFVIDISNRIINQGTIRNSSIIISRRDGKPIQNELILTKIYFWNKGNEPIDEDDVYEPLSITMGDPNAEIVDFTLLKSTRSSITKIGVLRDQVDATKKLNIEFYVLEHNDGACIQIVYDGKPGTKFSVTGEIREAGEINTYYSDLGRSVGDKWNFYQYIAALLTVMVGVLFPLIMIFKEGVRKENVSLLILGILLASLLLFSFHNIRETQVLGNVPNEILSN